MTLYQIMINKPAEDDMIEAARSRYIAKMLLDPSVANELLDDAEAAIHSLNINPQKHPLVSDDDLARVGIRVVPVDNYLLFYVVRESAKVIIIQRFLSSRLNWKNVLYDERAR